MSPLPHDAGQENIHSWGTLHTYWHKLPCHRLCMLQESYSQCPPAHSGPTNLCICCFCFTGPPVAPPPPPPSLPPPAPPPPPLTANTPKVDSAKVRPYIHTACSVPHSTNSSCPLSPCCVHSQCRNEVLALMYRPHCIHVSLVDGFFSHREFFGLCFL